MSVRVRFAPSPTGNVHIGNIRVAIFNWLFARHEGGKFLLRIEDTDRERSTPEAIKGVLDTMEWLGLDFNEEPLYQSARKDAHLAAAEELLKKGLAYKEDKGATGKGECVVFRMPDQDVAFHDEVKGDLRKEAKDLQDFVIVRSDGTPVFHLANVVDDIEMKITHIIRGDDHVENTFKHIPLLKALGAEPPKYAHLPMIINQQGKPYSKRDGSAFVGEFREMGFLAYALFNYLALLGWSPGGDREKMTREDMTALFTLDRVKSGPAQMDIKKLTHLNAEYVSELTLDEFAGKAERVIADSDWSRDIDKDYFMRVCELMQTRTHVLTYAEDWGYFFSDELKYDEKAVRKFLKKEGIRAMLTDLRGVLAEIDFIEEPIEQAIRQVERACDIKEGKLNQSVRIAVTGVSRGAGLYETMVLLGKERVLKRLDYAVKNLC
ncbi:glutamate--tRNA ligase [Verrucomicrobiota bacterium]